MLLIYRIEELTAAVLCKEMLIRELTEERSSLRERVTEMEEQLQELSTSLLQKERDAEVCVCAHLKVATLSTFIIL